MDKFFPANNNREELEHKVMEVKDMIFDNLIEMTIEDKTISSDILVNAVINMLAPMLVVHTNNDKELLIKMANNVRDIILQYGGIIKK